MWGRSTSVLRKATSLTKRTSANPMDAQQKDRYSRQILFAPIGESGQQLLLNSKAVLVGCGATGHRRSQSPNPRRPRRPTHHRPRFRRALQSPTPNPLRRIRRPRKSPESRRRQAPSPRHQFPSPGRSRSSRSNRKKRPRPASQFPTNSRWHRQFRNPPANQRRRHRPQHPVDLRRRRSQHRRNNDDHPRRNRLPSLPTRNKRIHE